MTDILCVGEILIDLTQTGTQQGIPQYAANPGGAPANVAVAAARLGASTGFIGKVGKDAFGDVLRQTLRENNVSDRGLFTDPHAPTTLAVVSVDSRGERSFSFYRDRSADTLLSTEEVLSVFPDQVHVLHIGSVSMTAEPSRTATLQAVHHAKAQGARISYDPNYRPSLWESEETAVHQMRQPLPLTDILKLSEEELPLLTGTSDLYQGTSSLAQQGVTLVLVTLGENGVFYRLGKRTGLVPGYSVTVADTNGAGDTFLGAVLSRLSHLSIQELRGLAAEDLEDTLRFANRAAALTCSRSGAIPAMPTLNEVC